MPGLRRPAAGSVAVLALALLSFSACTTAGSQRPATARTADASGDGRLVAIRFSSEGGVREIPVDEELGAWLNTIDASKESPVPVPKADAWQGFDASSVGEWVTFEATNHRSFDVLEVLSYPDGLDQNGVPVTTVVHPLCGPQAQSSCADLAWGAAGVRVSNHLMQAAIANTEYFAIGGVLLPPQGEAPESFMALLRN